MRACWSGRATTSTSRSSVSGWARARCASGSPIRRSGTAERGILERLEPVFTQLVDEGSLYLGGAAGLLADLRDGELASLREVVSALEERLQLLAALRDVLDSDRGWIRVGDDTVAPALRSLSLVAANYGIASRNLGTVALIGPQRMDYVGAMRAVRGAALALSDFVEEIYDA